MSSRIAQITPAQPGWRLMFAYETSDGSIHFWTTAVACWAIVDRWESSPFDVDSEPPSDAARWIEPVYVREGNYLTEADSDADEYVVMTPGEAVEDARKYLAASIERKRAGRAERAPTT